MTGTAADPLRWLRAAMPQLVLAVIPVGLAMRFGGYHPRHLGWEVLVLAAWACVLAARGKLSALRSVAGVATAAMLALVAWTTLSITWVDVSRHDAWVEALRAAGYAAMFVLGTSLLANARAYARYASLAGAGFALVAATALARVAFSETPLKAFVAGRLDWPISYAPGLAGLSLLGAFLLLGTSCAAQQRFARARQSSDLAASGVSMAGATACVGAAMLAQSRGTIPALAVGVVVALVATPARSAWLARAVVIAVAMAAIHGTLAHPFQAMFELRQAPFTEGADETALLAAAEDAARHAARVVFVVAVACGAIGAALVPIGRRIEQEIGTVVERLGRSLALPLTVLAVALAATLLAIGGMGEGSPIGWTRAQWSGCLDPPDTTNDPGSSSSYFANSGTGRCDYYRVALRSARERPLLGLGAGNFRGEYVRERTTREEPKVVHSLPLQLLAELGIVGLALGTTVLACVVIAARRFVRSGPTRDATFAGTIAALAYWATHASIDWLWQLPGVSLPMIALAGGLTACVSREQRPAARAAAIPLAAGAGVFVLALTLPLTMADAKLRDARDPKLQRTDASAALQAARDAQSFDPTWAEAAIVEADLLAKQGDKRGAADAARRAVELEPRNWSIQYRASGLIGLDSKAEGYAAYQRARELNPQLADADDDT